jgi:hypothetical protein
MNDRIHSCNELAGIAVRSELDGALDPRSQPATSGEEVEVAGYRTPNSDPLFVYSGEKEGWEKLITVTQHQRIVDGLRAEVERLVLELKMTADIALNRGIEIRTLQAGNDQLRSQLASHVYQCPRCATSLDADPTAKPATTKQEPIATVHIPKLGEGRQAYITSTQAAFDLPAGTHDLYAGPSKSDAQLVDLLKKARDKINYMLRHGEWYDAEGLVFEINDALEAVRVEP